MDIGVGSKRRKTVDIAVGDELFPCPEHWTVEKAEGRIRLGFNLKAGYLTQAGVPADSEAVIRDVEEPLVFVIPVVTATGK